MSVARLVTCQTETSAQGPLRQTLVRVKSIEMLIVFGIDMRFLKQYFSKIELVQLLAKMTRFWRFLMRKFYFPSKMKLPPPKIDFRPAFGTFLLFYYIIFSTEFTVDFLVVKFLLLGLCRPFEAPFVCAWLFRQTSFS